jgi:UDP-N-acetylmuramate dehydrogenase
MLSPNAVKQVKTMLPEALENELMAKHTNMRIGGPAALFLTVESPDVLNLAIQTAKEAGIDWYVMGGGSNMLVSDEGYNGLMLQLAMRDIKVRNQTITAQAGAITSLVARQAAEAGLEGLEWAIGVPGTIGGAVFGNAGCYGGEIADTLVTVDCIRLSDMKAVVYPKAQCKFGYRDSVFKHEPHIILRATFGLTRWDPDQVKSKMEDIAKVRKEKQPLDHGSAGCMFKNFVFTDDGEIAKLKEKVKDIPVDMLNKKSISAGWLVSQVGLLGERVGEAQISEKHGNFIVNLGNARAQDVLMLASMAKMKVRDEYDVLLEDEVQLVGF